MVGSDQTLTCLNDMKAFHCIWQRLSDNGTFADLKKDSRYIKHDSTIITIQNLTSSDSGVYRCRLFGGPVKTHYSSPIALCK